MEKTKRRVNNKGMVQDSVELNPIPPNLSKIDVTTFNTLDSFGMFLEGGVHAVLHNRAASVYHEPVLASYESPRISYF